MTREISEQARELIITSVQEEAPIRLFRALNNTLTVTTGDTSQVLRGLRERKTIEHHLSELVDAGFLEVRRSMGIETYEPTFLAFTTFGSE